jgi:hypothetical protein
MTTVSDIMPRAAAPCPSWCGQPAGHLFISEVMDDAVRTHALTVAKWQSPCTETVRSSYAVVEIVANAQATSEDLSTERLVAPPMISFYVEGGFDDLSPDQARDLGAFLSTGLRYAAKQLEDIIQSGDAAPPL